MLYLKNNTTVNIEFTDNGSLRVGDTYYYSHSRLMEAEKAGYERGVKEGMNTRNLAIEVRDNKIAELKKELNNE